MDIAQLEHSTPRRAKRIVRARCMFPSAILKEYQTRIAERWLPEGTTAHRYPAPNASDPLRYPTRQK